MANWPNNASFPILRNESSRSFVLLSSFINTYSAQLFNTTKSCDSYTLDLTLPIIPGSYLSIFSYTPAEFEVKNIVVCIIFNSDLYNIHPEPNFLV